MLDAREIGPGWDRSWGLPVDLLRAETAAYLADVADRVASPTRCPAWDGRGLTAHLAATHERIADLLRATRAGPCGPPFPVTQLAAVNQREAAAIVEGPDDEVDRLAAAVDAVLALVDDPDEPIAHQRGLVPVGLQLAWLLGELAVHHDDLLADAGGREPGSDVVAVVAPAYEVLAGLPRAPLTSWQDLLTFTGR